MEKSKQLQTRERKLSASFKKHGLSDDVEVLEYILGAIGNPIGANPTAQRLIENFGSLVGVVNASPDKLEKVCGISNKDASFLNFQKQFVTYYISKLREKGQVIKNTKDAVEYLREIMKTYVSEQFVLLCLDMDNRIISGL